jgi:hypothetical protein
MSAPLSPSNEHFVARVLKRHNRYHAASRSPTPKRARYEEPVSPTYQAETQPESSDDEQEQVPFEPLNQWGFNSSTDPYEAFHLGMLYSEKLRRDTLREMEEAMRTFDLDHQDDHRLECLEVRRVGLTKKAEVLGIDLKVNELDDQQIDQCSKVLFGLNKKQ